MALMQITVPPGAVPGGKIQVRTPAGQLVEVAVPPGMRPGQALRIQVPDGPTSSPPPPPAPVLTKLRKPAAGRQPPAAAKARGRSRTPSPVIDRAAQRKAEEEEEERRKQESRRKMNAYDEEHATRLAEKESAAFARRAMKNELEGMRKRLIGPSTLKLMAGPEALLTELEEHLTSNKKVDAITQYVIRCPTYSAKLGKGEVESVLQRMPYYLRWPEALLALQPRMDFPTSRWAEEAIQTMQDPRP